ncbi:MAG: hypothetical protein AAB019_01790 [Planctomycetota bacterium]
MMKSLLLIPVYIIKRWGLYIFTAGVAVFLVLLIHRKIYAHYATEPRYQIDLNHLQAATLPDWVTDKTIEQSIRTALQIDSTGNGSAPLTTNIIDENAFAKILTHYQQCPWVAKVHSIEKRFPNNLKLKLELRQPVVSVEVKRGNGDRVYYLVDKETVRLPGEYRTVPTLPMTLPVIAGVRTQPPPAGIQWADAGLRSALAVADVLEENGIHKLLAIDRIDVSNVNGPVNSGQTERQRSPDLIGSEITIWTKNKVPIQWGRSEYSARLGVGELSPEEKINNLKSVLRVSPKLNGVKYVKVQFHQPYLALESNR